MSPSECGLVEDCEWEYLGACVLNEMQMHYSGGYSMWVLSMGTQAHS